MIGPVADSAGAARHARALVAGAVLCLVLPACRQLTGADLSSAGGPPNAATAIVLSIPTDAIYLVDPVSGRVQPVVTDLLSLQAGYATWGPGHHSLVYGNAGVRFVDPKALTARVFVSGATVSMPALSTKGKFVVFGDGRRMWILPVRGPVPQLDASTAVPLPETLAPFAFDWVGAKPIVFEGDVLDCGHPEGCQATNRSDLWTIRSDGTDLTQVTFTQYEEIHQQAATDPKWAPGGARILFVRTSDASGFGSQLWSVRPNGSGAHRVIPATNVIAADWSPDGKRLVVIRTDPDGSSLQVWVGNANGTDLAQVGGKLPGTNATVDW
jgi:Tol biopolymer transport system component